MLGRVAAGEFRQHAGQFRVDGGAVVALHEVLDDQLPVRRHLIAKASRPVSSAARALSARKVQRHVDQGAGGAHGDLLGQAQQRRAQRQAAGSPRATRSGRRPPRRPGSSRRSPPIPPPRRALPGPRPATKSRPIASTGLVRQYRQRRFDLAEVGRDQHRGRSDPATQPTDRSAAQRRQLRARSGRRPGGLVQLHPLGAGLCSITEQLPRRRRAADRAGSAGWKPGSAGLGQQQER